MSDRRMHNAPIRPTHVVLIEDEPHNLRMLRGMLEKLRPHYRICRSFDSVQASVDYLLHHPHPDLLFMDIQLADGLCFSIFEQVKLKAPVIFTTAYDKYALRAFKVNSIDYLLKPFKESDLEAALDKFDALHAHAGLMALTVPDYESLLSAMRNREIKYRKAFLVSRSGGYSRIETTQIAYFYNEDRITRAVMHDKTEYILEFSLDALEEQLDPAMFFRANRQLLLNIASVQRVEHYFGGRLKLRLQPPLEAACLVSRLKAMAFKRWLDQ